MASFEFRRARATDETAVRALSAHILDGQDYVPGLFERWLKAKEGQFTVVYDIYPL